MNKLLTFNGAVLRGDIRQTVFIFSSLFSIALPRRERMFERPKKRVTLKLRRVQKV